MVGPECFAHSRVHASLVLACTGLELLGTLETVHVGSRSAHITDDTIELGGCSYALHLPYDGILAPGYDGATLHHCDGAEVALTVTSPMGGHGVPDGVHGLHVTLFRIVGVDRILELHSVDPVKELGIRQR